MSTKEIYLVVGECGSYSDWTTWPVAAYMDKAEADRHAYVLNEFHGGVETLTKDFVQKSREQAIKDESKRAAENGELFLNYKIEELSRVAWTAAYHMVNAKIKANTLDTNEYRQAESRYSVQIVPLVDTLEQYAAPPEPLPPLELADAPGR